MQVEKNELLKVAVLSIQEVNRLIKQFDEMKKMMKQMTNMQKGKKRI